MAEPTEPARFPEGPDPPEWAKLAQWLHHHFRLNWRVFVKPPVLAFAVIMAILGYYVGSTKDSERSELKDERIKFLGDQLAAYKDRLQGATPDEAAKEILSLRAQVEAQQRKLQILLPDNPRHLLPNERSSLQASAERISHDTHLLWVFAYNIGDAPHYAGEFVGLFQENKINAIGPLQTECGQGEHGILVGLSHPESPSKEALDFTQILRDAGLKVTHTKWIMKPDSMVQQQDFDLFICD